jgi:hypothetical protein
MIEHYLAMRAQTVRSRQSVQPDQHADMISGRQRQVDPVPRQARSGVDGAGSLVSVAVR